tara:strand:+ start:1403 stop:2062 length:660 start_codon:yes stop_codon:yes gene_type:complete
MFFIKEILKKIIYKLGLNSSINWPARAEEMGKDSVYDSRTLEKDKSKISSAQNLLYSNLINKELHSFKVSKVLDYGCGIGRHYELLSSLNCLNSNPVINGFDPTTALLKFSKDKGYSSVSDKFSYKSKFDLIFCHMVLGGLRDHEVFQSIMNMVRSLNFTGRIILVEAVNNSKPRLYTKWRIRNQESYMPPINGFEWTVLGETYENDDCLKVISGKFSS